MTTTVGRTDDLAEDWLSAGARPNAPVHGASGPYPKRSELRRAEARAASRRGADRRPAGGRPPGASAGRQRPPALVNPGRATEPARRPTPHQSGFAPMAPTPAVLPIQQTTNPSRPAGIDLRIPPEGPGPDAFHQSSPNTAPIPIVVPAPPPAPAELAAPVAPAFDPAVWGLDIEAAPATGRRRGPVEAEPAGRGRRTPPDASVPFPARLAGRGKAGAARLLVLALVVGAEGVAVTSMSGTTDSSNELVTTAASADLVSAKANAAKAPVVPDESLILAQAQSDSSDAKVSAARAQAKAEADRVRRAAARREEAMRNAQRNPQAIARIMVADRGWSSSQFSCLVSLWNRESGWNYRAANPSGAYGIPQSLPGSKMASAGSDWRTNPVTQIRWGLDYIATTYGTPCGAWAHSEAVGSY